MKIVFCSLETLNGLTLGFFRKIYNKNAKNYYIKIAIDPHKTFMISILAFYRILNILHNDDRLHIFEMTSVLYNNNIWFLPGNR